MFDFLGGGGGYRDPDKIMADAYGVDPQVLAIKRAEGLANMGALLVGASRGGDNSDLLKNVMAQGDSTKELGEMARLRLTGAQIKNAERETALKELAMQRDAAMQKAVLEQFWGGAAPGSELPSGPAGIAQAAGIPMVQAGQPIGNTPIDPNRLPVVTPGSGPVQAQAPVLSPEQSSMISQSSMPQRAAASQSIAAQLRAAGVPEAAVRGVGIMMLKDPVKGIEKANEYLMRKRVTSSERTDDGKLLQRDSDGFTTSVDVSTLGDQERKKRMEASVEVEKHYATAPTITGAPEVVNGRRIYTDQYGQPKVIEAPTLGDDENKARGAEAGKAREGLTKEGIEGLKSSHGEAKASVDQLEKIGQARDLIKGGVFSTNPIMDATSLARYAAIAEKWGINGFTNMGDSERTAALASIGRGMAKDMIKGLGANPTDADLRAAMEMAGANPNMLTEKQMLRIFQENEKLAKTKIEAFNTRRDKFAKVLSEKDQPLLDSIYGRIEAPGSAAKATGGQRTERAGGERKLADGRTVRTFLDAQGNVVGYEEL